MNKLQRNLLLLCKIYFFALLPVCVLSLTYAGELRETSPDHASVINNTPQPTAQEEVMQKIVIYNVTFVDPEKKKKNAVANLVIKNKYFDLVTQDEIALSPTDIVFDAQEGFILGALELGKIANFLILDSDPHQDINALLDTKKHVLLAIHNGIIIRNNLKAGSNLAALEKKKMSVVKRSGWLAYTPPPIVLPSNYKESDWIKFDNDYFSTILVGALAMDRQKWEHQDADSIEQVGDIETNDGGEIRALRFGLAGAIKFDKPWVYTIAGATNSFDKGFDTNTTDSISFFDWRLDIPVLTNSTLSIGKQKEPISMERLIGMVYLPMQERSVVSDALLPSRNFGAVLSGTAYEQRVSWAGGLFNDWIEDGGTIKENASQLIGRVTWLPYESANADEVFHLGVGMRYSNSKESVRYASEPEFNSSPLFIDSGDIDADSSFTYNLEASWRKGPVWLLAEYTENRIQAAHLEDPKLSGYHVNAVLSLTGEMREYNKRSATFLPIQVARSVKQGGLGAIEVSSRWSVFKGNNGSISAGDTDILSLGLTWWLTPKFNLNVNYRWIELDRCSFISEACNLQGKSNGFNTRLTLFL